MQWKIGPFHKVIKSRCRAEASKRCTAERLTNLIEVFCIVEWRIFWMTMMIRVAPSTPPELALTDVEQHVLDLLLQNRPDQRSRPALLSSYLTKTARLGGYLARAKDPPPGNTVMWRGLSRLIDIELGFTMGLNLWVIESRA